MIRQPRFRKRFALLALLGVVGFTATGNAADILVTTASDSGTGSLREAMTMAVNGDRIVFQISGTPTIELQSDLPEVDASVSFANSNTGVVTIDRRDYDPLSFTGAEVDPTILVVINTGSSGDVDIVSGASTAVYGSGLVTGNLRIPGVLSPGSDTNAGTLGTFRVAGDADLTGAEYQVDLVGNGPTPRSDLVSVSGTATVTNATLAPRITGSSFEIGQRLLVLESSNALQGSFANQSEAFQLTNNPFLQAVEDTTRTAMQFGFVIEDNNRPFADVVTGCNQTSAALLLDSIRSGGSPPASVLALRNGSVEEVNLAVNQLSGSIYPSLINAEINHVQTGLESIRNMMVRQALGGRIGLSPWIRGYGIHAEVGVDDCQTLGYRQEVGGVEMGCGLGTDYGISGTLFSQFGFGEMYTAGVEQDADTNSYRFGGSLGYVNRYITVLAAGGAGVQDYDVRRSLSALEGSTFVQSSFDGSSQFGYFEVACTDPITPYLALHATRVELDPIRETGDPFFALSNDGGTGNSLRSVLGLACYKANGTSFGVAATSLRFGWLHEYLDESEIIVSQIAGSSNPEDVLVDRGVSAGRDWGFARLQVDMGQFLGGYLTVGYEGHYNSDSAFNWLLIGWMH